MGIDKTFRETLGAIHKIKNAVNATDVEGQQKTLESMGRDLELCEKDLADFLESKRRIFPRFYFLATTYARRHTLPPPRAVSLSQACAHPLARTRAPLAGTCSTSSPTATGRGS